MEGSARGAPFCKEIFFLFLEKKERGRIEKIGRREEAVTLLQSELEHICKEAFLLIQTESSFSCMLFWVIE
jgi:hypothetical protein